MLSVDVLNVAVPPDNVPVPMGFPLLLNVTVPVGVPTVLVTVAVNVTKSLKFDGLRSDVTLVVVAAFTIKVPEAELAPKFPCVAYAALKVWLPTLGMEIVKVVDPLLSVCVTAVLPSTLNDTSPVGVNVELTVTVTLPSAPYVIPGALSVIDVAPTPTPRLPEAELAPKFPCAVYVALKLWGPTLGIRIVKVVDPLLSGRVIGVPLSTLNETSPVGVPAVELTVTVTLPFVPYVTVGALIVVVVAA